MEYLVGPNTQERPHVDGAILQGGLSDREAFGDIVTKDGTKDKYDEVVVQAKKMLDQGQGQEMMIRKDNVVCDMFGAPMTAYRTYSLLSVGGDDDYFSSDLSDDRI